MRETTDFCLQTHRRQLLWGLGLYIVVIAMVIAAISMLMMTVATGMENPEMFIEKIITDNIALNDPVFVTAVRDFVIPFAVVYCLVIVLQLFFQVFLYTMAIVPSSRFRELLTRALGWFLPFVLQQLCILLLCLIGLVPAIAIGLLSENVAVIATLTIAWVFFLLVYLAPRLVLAPVILISESTQVVASLRLSFARSRGFWWKIVSNILACVFLVYAAAAVFGLLVQVYAFIGALLTDFGTLGTFLLVPGALLFFTMYVVGLYLLSVWPTVYG